MNFCEAVDYVKSLDIYGSVLSLDNMRMLSELLGHPESELKFIHVTGTNGKGSVCAFISRVLTEAGYITGAYNSPAVISDIDQYTINTDIISEEAYAAAVSAVRDACEKIHASGGIQPTRFEVETMVAFLAFKEAKCDLVVLETGLGGRDDATNIVENTLLHIFTSISLDHCAVLGNTYAEIAEVKSGIIKNNSPVLLYTGTGDIEAADSTIYDEITNVISGRCNETGATLYTVSNRCISNLTVHNNKLRFSVPELELYDIDISMTGAYQPVNAVVALYALRLLADMGYQISEKNIRKGLKKARIPFRFEKIVDKNQEVNIILDGAHNPDGAARLMDSLNLNYPDRKMIFITGIFKDKDYEKIAEITGGRADAVFAVENNLNARALPKDELASVLTKYNKNVITCDSIEDAIDNAVSMAKANSLSDIEMNLANSGLFYKPIDDNKPIIVCFGSLSWLNRAKEYIKSSYSNQNNKKKDAGMPDADKQDAGMPDADKQVAGKQYTDKHGTDKQDTSLILNNIGDNALDAAKIREGINLILEGIGEDAKREGLADTPDRVVRMYEEIFSGINQTAEYELSRTFESKSKDMVVERDITFYSMCEHHLMPFYGKAHIAYIPNGKVVGISKLARCVDIYARKPQIQERLTEEIADAIMEYLKPKGVMVMLEAEHMCMTMRGVKKPGTKTVTVSIRGKMRKRENQDMFFDLVGRRASID